MSFVMYLLNMPCHHQPLCQSVVWDRSVCLCYQYRVTATLNPAILLNRMGSDYFERTCGSIRLMNQKTQTSSQDYLPPSENSLSRTTSSVGCSAGSKFAYFLAANLEMIPDSVDKVTHYTEENKCIAACTDIDWCRSITLFPTNQTCIASHSTLPPTGTSKSISNPNAVYLEKFCLPTAAPDTCAEQFFYIFSRKNLNNFTISTAHKESIADCAGTCTVTAGCKNGLSSKRQQRTELTICIIKHFYNPLLLSGAGAPTSVLSSVEDRYLVSLNEAACIFHGTAMAVVTNQTALGKTDGKHYLLHVRCTEIGQGCHDRGRAVKDKYGWGS
uniref:Apple domain-containing protein n=1 Tax=Romanomermis culicivorax TaxID=13658 RepID=A0A915K842_ROMCU